MPEAKDTISKTQQLPDEKAVEETLERAIDLIGKVLNFTVSGYNQVKEQLLQFAESITGVNNPFLYKVFARAISLVEPFASQAAKYNNKTLTISSNDTGNTVVWTVSLTDKKDDDDEGDDEIEDKPIIKPPPVVKPPPIPPPDQPPDPNLAEEIIARIARFIADLSDYMGDVADFEIDKLQDIINSGNQYLRERLESAIEDLNDSLDDSVADILSGIETGNNDIIDTINDAVNELNDAIDSVEAGVGFDLKDIDETIDNAVNDSTNQITSDLDDLGDEIGGDIDNLSTEINKNLEDQTKDITKIINDALEGLSFDLSPLVTAINQFVPIFTGLNTLIAAIGLNITTSFWDRFNAETTPEKLAKLNPKFDFCSEFEAQVKKLTSCNIKGK